MRVDPGIGLSEGRVISGRFRLVRPLSRGGMGAVWLATHTTLGTEVAIKFVDMSGDIAKDALSRFEKEATVVARLRSQHVVQILDYGVEEGIGPYLAMELLTGESLKERIDRHGPMSIAATARLIVHVASALSRAHNAGVIHRDIKPANIFLCDEEDGFVAKVLDFGVAKAWLGDGDHQMTASGALVGTPAFMSPEQALGGAQLDGRSDLFSLGLVAWCCLTARHPHEQPGRAIGLGELLVAIATRPAPPPSSVIGGLPPAIDEWFTRALALKPSERFATAREMAQAFVRATGASAAEISGVGAAFRTGSLPSIPDVDAAAIAEAPTHHLVRPELQSRSDFTPRSVAQSIAAVPPKKWPIVAGAIAGAALLVGVGLGTAGTWGFTRGKADTTEAAAAGRGLSDGPARGTTEGMSASPLPTTGPNDAPPASTAGVADAPPVLPPATGASAEPDTAIELDSPSTSAHAAADAGAGSAKRPKPRPTVRKPPPPAATASSSTAPPKKNPLVDRL